MWVRKLARSKRAAGLERHIRNRKVKLPIARYR